MIFVVLAISRRSFGRSDHSARPVSASITVAVFALTFAGMLGDATTADRSLTVRVTVSAADAAAAGARAQIVSASVATTARAARCRRVSGTVVCMVI
jgi:hypothetical protein